MKKLKIKEIKYETIENFLISLKKKFEEKKEKLVKIIKLKKLKQEKRTIKKFV